MGFDIQKRVVIVIILQGKTKQQLCL